MTPSLEILLILLAAGSSVAILLMRFVSREIREGAKDLFAAGTEVLEHYQAFRLRRLELELEYRRARAARDSDDAVQKRLSSADRVSIP